MNCCQRAEDNNRVYQIIQQINSFIIAYHLNNKNQNLDMGHQQSKNQILKYQQNYSQIQKQEHPFLGTITHLTHRNDGSKHFLKVFKFATDHEINQAHKKATKRKQLSQKRGSIYIVKTTEIQITKQNQLCGMTHYLYIVYEDYQASLGDLIRQRKQSNNFFSQQQILDFIRNVCNGLIFLQDNGYTNYTITKQSIVKGYRDNNQNSNYKLFDTDLAKEMLPYPKLMNGMGIQKGIYLSPQALQEILNKNQQPEFSLKNQIFSIGMVALEMCCLQPLDYLYDYNRLKIQSEALSQRIKNLKNYSPYLRILIQEMVENNQQQRIGAVSLRQKLSINDNKSTTDNGFSAIGNSNVTQRTHKISYPLNNVSALNARQPSSAQTHPNTNQPNNNTSADNINKFKPQTQNRIARALTVDQIKNHTLQPPVNVPINENIIKKNQTYDQFNIKTSTPLYNQYQNKSIQRFRLAQNDFQAQEKKRANVTPNYPFYVPHNLKPITMNLAQNVHTQNYTGREQFQNHQPQQAQAYHIIHQVQQIQQMPAQQTQQNYFTLNQHLTHIQPQQKSNPVNKIQQIQIPEHINERAKDHPQTPINYLNQSDTMFASQPKFKKNECNRDTLIEQLQVLTSMNADFKKSLSVNQQILNQSTKNQYESPCRKQQQSLFASGDSTPIRKVQALQSVPRNSFDQIIKQTLQQNQSQSRNLQKNINNKVVQKEQVLQNRPKSYGKHHFTNGAIYQGQFDAKGNFCGNGVLYYPDGKVCYSGGWINNSFHGFGVLNNEIITKNNLPTNYQNFNLNDSNAWHHFEGEFCMDKKNGFGSLYMSNGDKFSGSFVNDAIEGYGTFTSAKGERVSGIWNQNVLKKF